MSAFPLQQLLLSWRCGGWRPYFCEWPRNYRSKYV